MGIRVEKIDNFISHANNNGRNAKKFANRRKGNNSKMEGEKSNNDGKG